MKTIIISGGSLDYDFAAWFIKKEEPDCLIAADCGMRFCYETGIFPDFVMGDFDSTHTDILDYFRMQKNVRIIEFPPEKDDTDTEIAIKTAVDMGSRQIFILGALGGRMDHCLANIHLLKAALDRKAEAILVDKQNLICLLDKSCEITKSDQYGAYVSFLPFTDQVEGVTLKGFKYPLENFTMTKGNSLGVSNEIADERCQVLLTKGILLMIQAKD